MTAFLCNYFLLWIGWGSFFFLQPSVGMGQLQSLSALICVQLEEWQLSWALSWERGFSSNPSSCGPGQEALRKRAELCSQQNWGSIREASGAEGCLMLQYFGTAVPVSPFRQWQTGPFAQPMWWQLWVRGRGVLLCLLLLMYGAQAKHKNWLHDHTVCHLTRSFEGEAQILGQILSPPKAVKIIVWFL